MNDDEFGRIERLRRALGADRGAPEGIGDDGAVLRAGDGRVVVLDTLVEGTHFRLDWCDWADVGYRLVSTNVSDVWAMGAEPTAMLLGLTLPRGASGDVVDAIGAGMGEALAALDVDVALVGGDTTSSTSTAVLTLTVMGRAVLDPVPARSAARAGQGVFCLGDLGLAAAGVAALSARCAQSACDDAIAAHRRPTPPRPEWDALAQSGVGAMIDVSDGLSSDLWHIVRASNVGIELDAASLVPGERIAELAAIIGGDATAWMWHGGDDYARIATCDRSPGGAWRRIGTVLGPGASLTAVHPDGTRESIVARGYRHG